MNVLFVSSEVAPFAKTGGLGDVASALPKALARRGHDVRVVMPLYARIDTSKHDLEPLARDVPLTLGGARLSLSFFTCKLPGSDVPVYFVHCPALYGRQGIYTEDHDEHLRFAALSWGALLLAQRLGFRPDVVHANDWQTALLPLLLRTMFSWDRLFAGARTLLTIHNIGHQGSFDARVLAETGLADAAHHFHQDQLREGRVNFLLTGILYASAITTVSPTYAREIMTPEHGVGLDGFLRERREVVFGVLNGIDEIEWGPRTDRYIAHPYDVDDLDGKEKNKRALLETVGLPYFQTAPVFGIVSRLAWQKGFDLCFEVLPALLRHHAAQLVVVGTGEPKYERLFFDLGRRFPRQVAYKRGFSEPLAHQVEAGADMFLMPSRYEPCGLNQLYSLRYGTPPIVHRTGGLADTVTPFSAARGTGNGFVFEHFDDSGLSYAIRRALAAFGSGKGEHRALWRRLQENGMRGSYGWDERVVAYEQVYRLVAPGR